MDLSKIEYTEVARMYLKHPTTGKVLQNDDVDFDAEKMSAIEVLSRCTKDWNITLNGKQPEVSYKEAKKLYSDFHWVRHQVDTFIHTRANFLADSSTN